MKKIKTKTAKKTTHCPISTVLSLIGHKWKIFVIRDLLEGAKRFNELKKSTGASQKSLTIHLRELEDRGIVERKAYKEVPRKGFAIVMTTGTEYSVYIEQVHGLNVMTDTFQRAKSILNKNVRPIA